mmetsp:Transcript_68440/g.182568  ORF Transcript_68440/g.182568 Transcript_68440/m.182568 type:complete len:410 (+) Transcript_68440:743-1972(+)
MMGGRTDAIGVVGRARLFRRGQERRGKQLPHLVADGREAEAQAQVEERHAANGLQQAQPHRRLRGPLGLEVAHRRRRRRGVARAIAAVGGRRPRAHRRLLRRPALRLALALRRRGLVALVVEDCEVQALEVGRVHRDGAARLRRRRLRLLLEVEGEVGQRPLEHELDEEDEDDEERQHGAESVGQLLNRRGVEDGHRGGGRRAVGHHVLDRVGEGEVDAEKLDHEHGQQRRQRHDAEALQRVLALGRRGTLLLVNRLHHADAQRDEHRHRHWARRHRAAVPRQAQEGAEVGVAPPHVARRQNSGNQSGPDQREHFPSLDEAHSAEHSSEPDANADHKNSGLLILQQCAVQIRSLLGIDKLGKRGERCDCRLGVSNQDAKNEGNAEDSGKAENSWQFYAKLIAHGHNANS